MAAEMPAPSAVPQTIKQRLDRGRAAMRKDAPKRRLCVRFERGDSYWFINSRNLLGFQNTATAPDGSGRPPHRVRNTYNLIRPVIQAKVSTATQRTPAYQVLPSTTDDQRKVSAAELAQKAAVYGYDQWGVGDARAKAVFNAIGGGGEGFAMPYFDANVGPYIPVADPVTGLDRYVGQGEIKILVLSGNEVFWEPGSPFDESRWWAIERATPIDDVKEMPGFSGVKLTADAQISDVPTDAQPSDQMVVKTEYLERPCPRWPEGRRLVIVNGQQVVPEEPYPVRDAQGTVIDEPAIHRLAWDIGDGSLRDFGLTWQLIDSQRTVQDAINRAVEYKNRVLLPQLLARKGSVAQRRTDEPGAIIWWEGADPPQWEKVPEIPESLFRIINQVQSIMRVLASDDQAESQADYANVAAKTLQQVLEQSLNRWDAFRTQLAAWDSRVMRHCLLLCARYYTEPRLLKIKGRDGWEHIQDFKGADMLGQTDVKVMSDSLVPQTRQGTQDQITWLNANFPGAISAQDALVALREGSLDRLTESYMLDLARANTVIQRIRQGTVMQMPSRGTTNPLTGQPELDPQTGQPSAIPGYMPDQQDNLAVWEKVFADWMKTDDYARQPPQSQEVTRQVWDAIQALKARKAQQEAALQNQMAADAGLRNAAAPQTPRSMPSLPGSQVEPPART